jgi:cysteine desulfurase
LLLHGAGAPRLPNTLSVSFPDVAARELLGRTPELCASTGAACHSGVTSMSPTLAAIGATPEQAAGMLRLSLGWSTTDEEIERAASLLLGAWDQLTA